MKKYGVAPLPNFFIKTIEDDDLFIIYAVDRISNVIDKEETFKMRKGKGINNKKFSKKIVNFSKKEIQEIILFILS